MNTTTATFNKVEYIITMDLYNYIRKLEQEIKITDDLLEERNGLLRSIPECRIHGNQCIPNAKEWIDKRIYNGKE